MHYFKYIKPLSTIKTCKQFFVMFFIFILVLMLFKQEIKRQTIIHFTYKLYKYFFMNIAYICKFFQTSKKQFNLQSRK